MVTTSAPNVRKSLTNSQIGILEFIRNFEKINDASPTLVEIADARGIHYYTLLFVVHDLARRGLVTWRDKRKRTLRVLETDMSDKDVYRALCRMMLSAGESPSFTELATEIGIYGADLWPMLRSLKERGWIDWDSSRQRSFRVLKMPSDIA